jgi:hypothetical protein
MDGDGTEACNDLNLISGNRTFTTLNSGVRHTEVSEFSFFFLCKNVSAYQQ